MSPPRLLPRLLASLVLLAAPLLRADDAAVVAAVRATDDERVAAILAADAPRLGAILSDGLHYAHANGKTDTKASFIESLVSRRTIYRQYDYQRREFTVASPEIVLMSAKLTALVANGTEERTLELTALAVWRREGDRWRFLAWQSARLPGK